MRRVYWLRTQQCWHSHQTVVTWPSHEVMQWPQVLVTIETLFTVSDAVFLVEQLSAMPFNSDEPSLHRDRALHFPRLAGNISVTGNYHPQRKEPINDLSWNQVWILMTGWPSRILIRGDTFRASLTFLPRIPVETMHWMWAKCKFK